MLNNSHLKSFISFHVAVISTTATIHHYSSYTRVQPTLPPKSWFDDFSHYSRKTICCLLKPNSSQLTAHASKFRCVVRAVPSLTYFHGPFFTHANFQSFMTPFTVRRFAQLFSSSQQLWPENLGTFPTWTVSFSRTTVYAPDFLEITALFFLIRGCVQSRGIINSRQ